MASTYTPLGIEIMATGENAGTWGTKTNANLNLFEQLTGGFSTLSIAGGAQTTDLTVIDGTTTGTAQYRMIEFTGTITGNQIVTIPLDVETFYFLRNSTTGSFTVQFKYVTGSGTSSTFATDDKGDKLLFAAADDGTNPNIKEIALGEANEVTLNGVETLTNKTLTSPKIETDILDTNGAELLNVTATASAVNELTLANAATGNKPTITASGDDTNIGVSIQPKGSGTITIDALTFPAADGTADQILKTDGSGNLSFGDVAGGASWQAVITADPANAVAGNGYFVNTTSAAFTITLPTSAAIGDFISFIDYAGTFDTNNLTIGRNGHNIQGAAADLTVATERAGFTLVYVDATQGWLLQNN